MALADLPRIDGLTLESRLWRLDDRALYRTVEGRLVEVAPAATLDQARSAANRASMETDVWVGIGEVRTTDAGTLIEYNVDDGLLLSEYVTENFGQYMAEENFSLDVVFHLCEAARIVKQPLDVTPERIFIDGDGRVRLLCARLDEVSERAALIALGELLFGLLTREDCRQMPGAVLESRHINGEISSSAEAIIRRCVQGPEGGGYGSLASLRHAIAEVLRGRGHEVSMGRLRDFRRHRPRVEYEAGMRASLEAQTEHLNELRSRREPAPIERVLHRLFGDPEKVGLRILWMPLVAGYLALIAPLLLARMSINAILTWMALIFVLYGGLFVGIYVSYRRHRE